MNEMNDFLIHMGISAAILLLCYIAYSLLLRSNTHFSVRRGFIILSVGLSLLLPFGQFQLAQSWQVELPKTFTVEETVTPTGVPVSEQELTESWSPIPVLGWMYILISASMVIRLGISFYRVIRIVRQSVPISPSSFRTRISDHIQAPFTFFRYILLPASQQYNGDKDIILLHENTHVEKRHFLDLLFFELMLCLQWINPAMWLFRKEIMKVHEHEADQEVLNHDIDKKTYQLTILKYAVGNQKFALASAFNQLQTLTRIHMMNKKRSSAASRLKILSLIPIGIICLLLNSAFRPATDLHVTFGDELTIEGIVLDATSYDPIIGATILLKESDAGTITNKQGAFSISVPANSSKILVFSFLGKSSYEVAFTQSGSLKVLLSQDETGNSHSFAARKGVKFSSVEEMLVEPFGDGKEPVFIVDGSTVSKETLDKMDPDKIATVNVYKDEKAIEKYGDKAKNGVVVVRTKKKEKISLVPSDTDEKAQPLIVVDGEEFPRGSLKELDPDDIEKINVVKGEKAIEKYGEKGKNGVIEVTKKN
ncbi:MAG: carboxypeptidase-like regulatory domain-containing protein [Bacteroidota bacterium]